MSRAGRTTRVIAAPGGSAPSERGTTGYERPDLIPYEGLVVSVSSSLVETVDIKAPVAVTWSLWSDVAQWP
ncbi:cyclase, partial [Streptomyces sp. SID724]|nr:cyclase [Streptomyces sp. SID724]